MIDELTPEQESKVEEYVKRWTAIGLCTDPADRPKAEEAIRKCYEKGGLKAPKKIIWCGSPFSQVITRSILINLKNESVWGSVLDLCTSVRNSVWDSVGGISVRRLVKGSVFASLRGSIWASLRESIRESVNNAVRNSVWDSVRNSVWDSVLGAPLRESVCVSVRESIVGSSIWSTIDDSVINSLWFPLSDSVWESVYNSIYGSHEACWLSFYSFIRNELGLVEQTEPITGLLELVLHCGWIFPCKEICFASERHNVLKRDERGRLHCTDGPAVSYPDGWNIYAVHGVRVPGYIITSPQEITVEKIEEEENAEIRRVMIDTYGQNRYMEDSGATLIHEDSYGKLYKKDLQDDEPIVMVKVVNSTAEPNGTFKEYFLRVPPDTKTAHEAVAWTFGKQDKTYNPALET